MELIFPFSQKVLDYLRKNMITTMEIFSILTKLQADMPKGTKHSEEDSIIFEDVLGRTKNLPYIYFRYWGVFESMLRCEFQGLPGERKILAGQYVLMTIVPAIREIDTKDWGRK